MTRQFQPTIVCDNLADVPGFAGLLRGQYVRVAGTLGRVLGTVDGVPYWTHDTQPPGFRAAVLAFRMMVARRLVRAAILGPAMPSRRVMPAIDAPGSCLAVAMLAYIVFGLASAVSALLTLRRGTCAVSLFFWAVATLTYARGWIFAPEPETDQ